MGEHRAPLRQEFGSERADPPAGHLVLPGNGAGLADRGLLRRLDRAGRIGRAEDAVDPPSQVDRGRPGAPENLGCPVEIPAEPHRIPLAAPDGRKRHTHRPCDPERRGAADRKPPDRTGEFVDGSAARNLIPPWEKGLVDVDDAVVLRIPGDGVGGLSFHLHPARITSR